MFVCPEYVFLDLSVKPDLLISHVLLVYCMGHRNKEEGDMERVAEIARELNNRYFHRRVKIRPRIRENRVAKPRIGLQE